MTKNVAILMGGWSDERDISLQSGQQVLSAAKKLGYNAFSIDVKRNLSSLIKQLDPAPDVVLNLLHGPGGEDGRIQAVLDILNIPYAFSGVLGSAIAMNKAVSKKIFQWEGLPVADGKAMPVSEAFSKKAMDFPYVIKPLNEGSSLGIFLVFSESDIPDLPNDWVYGADVMVEQYIPGREIEVAIMGDRALGAIELRPKQAFYDYQAKYTEGLCQHIMPAEISEDAYAEALKISLKATKALGCQGVSRVDLRYDDVQGEPGKFYILEVNTQPGMTSLSIVPEIAQSVGISFEELVKWIIENPTNSQ